MNLYEEVCRHARRTALLTSMSELIGWDERTQMPAAGSEHRAEQSTILAGLIHQQWIDPKFGEQLAELSEQLGTGASPDAISTGQISSGSEPVPNFSSDQSVVVRRLRRQRDKRVKLPQTLVEELARTSVLGQGVWQEAREKNDFPSFRPLLEKMFELKRQQAEALGYPECPYDALLDEFEPEELTSNVAQILAKLRDDLVPLAAKVQQSDRKPNTSVLHRRFPVDVQDRFARDAATAIGFDFARGRLDVTAHPFCTTLGPHDCRITTRYNEQYFNSAFFGVLHESGHGMYEQGLPAEHFGLPIGEAISLGIHESQSRMWENLVGRSLAFWTHFYPLAQKSFPAALGDVSLEEFHFAINDVRPSLIRIEADEATYNLHILIRFELEQSLIDGNLPVADLPGAWNEKYKQYLGITPPNDSDGVLQDVHWSAGLIGYFPTYSLGNLYSAQFFAQAESELGNLAELFARGDFRTLLEWLRKKIHSQGQRYSASELVQRVTNRPLSAHPLVEHLRAKVGLLYEL